VTVRSGPPSTDPVYSEADLASIRSNWESTQKDREFSLQMAQVIGRLDAFPSQMEAIARKVVLEVLSDTRRTTTAERWSHWPTTLNLIILTGGFLFELFRR
jgi:hypothetical protein